jgi:Tfp pilus assembly protein PilO
MSDRSKQLSNTLAKFYEKPVAKVSLELFLSIGLITLLGVFAIQPTILTMTNLITEIDEKQALHEQLKKKVSALQTAQVVYTKVEPRLELLTEAVPPQPQLVRTIKIIEKLATENNIVISGLSSKDIPQEVQSSALTPVRKNLPLVITVTGDYPSIRAFATALLKSRRTFIIDTISFAITENRSERSLSTTITINAPYYGGEQ